MNSCCKKVSDVERLIKDHQEALKNQDRIYAKNLQSNIRHAGAGLDSDDLSKVAEVEVIGKGTKENLRK